MASDPQDASPSSGSSGDVSPLGRVYNFFVDAPAWILSGMGLVVTFAQVLWVANYFFCRLLGHGGISWILFTEVSESSK